MFISVDLIFKTKHTTNLADSCYKREPRLEAFCIHNSELSLQQQWSAQGTLFSAYVRERPMTTVGP